MHRYMIYLFVLLLQMQRCVSAFLFDQVSSGTLQFGGAHPAVTAVTPPHVDMPKVAPSAREAQLELTA